MRDFDLTPRRLPAISYALIGTVCGIAMGIKFADIDLLFPSCLLHHRALLTHGFILPLCLSWIVWRTRLQFLRGVTLGFCVTNTVHLSFDLFPQAWRGYALIHLFWLSFPPLLSWIWIAGSLVICWYLWRMFVRTLWELCLSAAGLLAGFVVYAHEGILSPLIAMALSAMIAFLFPLNHSRSGRREI
ncbi:hypothetical protein CSB45_13615 [candidate division KSB3 bacterium]|uniref:Uncharacterized protein n=1 Tax=candidate division KSB3 bacterium TaxID=2044937 RepID=A0A2G6E1N2_9BACT|nr:MAG: hypothetical protein CSB45_13615 [candidate division KSB3 bacterium]PIE28597.1 MAG: hypothetical protein CSA57_13265 [candidate division KSB3 bacterium]